MKNKGISLIVLIITIVVIIILATAIIVNLAKSNIIKNANKAVLEDSIANLKLELEVYITNKILETLGEYDRTKLNADETKAKYGEENIEDKNKDGKVDIYDILSSLEKSILKGKVYIENGELIFDENKEIEDEEVKKISVKYNGNGGILNNSDEQIIIEVDANSTITLPQNTFNYTMYDFSVWTDINGNEYKAGDKYQVGDETIEFWAKWEYKVKEELSCLITTGNQYIDTGYIPNQDTSIEIQFQLLSRKAQFIYGSRQGDSKNTYALIYYCNGTEGYEGFRSDYGSNDNKQITTQGYEGIQTIKKEKNKVYINGTLKYTHTISNFSTASSGVDNNLTLFNVNTNGSINSTYFTKLKFYYCKIWDRDTLVRDFIPVIDNSGAVCILDRVENKLYYAQYGDTTEKFEQEKDIIEISSTICNGSQYIDTGFKADKDTTVEMKCKINNSVNQALFGARTTDLSKTFSCFFISASTTSGGIRFDYNTKQTSYNNGYTYGTPYIIKQDKNNFYINGVHKGSTTYNTFNTDYNLYLFAVNTSGTVERNSYIECYYCKIWDGDTLVRDYVPVLDSNNIVCLYDKVGKKYYYGKGADLLIGRE